MNDDAANKKKKSLPNRVGMTVAQSLFSRKETLFNKTVKSVVGIGVNQFQKRTGHMKDEIIDADIGFTAEELNNYQFGSNENDENK